MIKLVPLSELSRIVNILQGHVKAVAITAAGRRVFHGLLEILRVERLPTGVLLCAIALAVADLVRDKHGSVSPVHRLREPRTSADTSQDIQYVLRDAIELSDESTRRVITAYVVTHGSPSPLSSIRRDSPPSLQ
jgi:hypothetical protein